MSNEISLFAIISIVSDALYANRSIADLSKEYEYDPDEVEFLIMRALHRAATYEAAAEVSDRVFGPDKKQAGGKSLWANLILNQMEH